MKCDDPATSGGGGTKGGGGGGTDEEDPCPCPDSKNMGPYWLSMSELAHPLILSSKDGISTFGDSGDGGERGG
jgi:hypothetical protein